MTKREINDMILDTVCSVCEVSVDDIMNGVKKAEVVEVRSMAAHYLQRYGITPGDVIRFSGGSVKHRYCVTKSASMYYDRYGQSFSFRSEADGFVFNRFYSDCVRKGLPIPWEECL